MSEKFESQCYFCGCQIGEISERTDEIVNKIYYCPKCEVDYCDQCSYEYEKKNKLLQVCLRCNSELID